MYTILLTCSFTPTYFKIYLLILSRNYEQYSVICRPWVTIDGETSQQLLRMFREMVLMLILGNPGISWVKQNSLFLHSYMLAWKLGHKMINS